MRPGSNTFIYSNLNLPLILSFVIVVLMAAMSLAGLVVPENLYPSEEAIQSFMVNDVINLFIVLPVLLSSMWFSWRGKLVGILSWPGALLTVFYNYTAYVFGIPFRPLTFAYIMLVLLSAYTIYDILKKINGQNVKSQLDGVVPVKLGGWFLVFFGTVFLLRAAGMLSHWMIKRAALPSSEIGVLIADVILSLIWIAGGVLLLRKSPLGFVSAFGLLFAASMLFAGLIIFLILQPLITDATFSISDIIVIFLMGLVCFIPFILFARGVLSIGNSFKA
jgi:hypothetical protein